MPEQPAVQQLAALQESVAELGDRKPMTREEYEEARRNLEADAADAKKALNRARAVYDGICDELRNLRVDWNEQQKADRNTGT